MSLALLGAGPPAAWAARAHRLAGAHLAGAAALARMGADGRAAAAFAGETAPRFKVRQPFAAVSSGSSLSGIGRALSGNGGGGMGFPLPALLLVSLAAAVGYGAWRLNQRGREG